MKIIIVRHGLSEANISQTFSLDDTKLHKDGYEVLENTKKALEKYDIEKVYTSALFRAQETARLLGYEDFEIDPRLNELNFGNFKGKHFEDVRRDHADFFDAESTNYFQTRYPNGESRLDLIARTSEFYDEISKDDGNILCVSHGLAIKASLFWIMKDLENWKSFWIENGAITIFDVNDDRKLIEGINIL